MAPRIQVVFDAADPLAQATFWAEVLGYVLPDPPPEYETWTDFARAMGIPEEEWDSRAAAEDPTGEGPRIYFQKVPEGKVVKNRVHLDVKAGGPRGTPAEERRASVAAEVERLVALGATKIRDHDELGEHWVVMADPEGNEFCLV